MAIGPSNGAQPLESILIVDVTPERIARIRRIRDYSSPTHDIRGLADGAYLGRNGMKLEIFAGHAHLEGAGEQSKHPGLIRLSYAAIWPLPLRESFTLTMQALLE